MITYLDLHKRICAPVVANPSALSALVTIFDNVICPVLSLKKNFVLQKTSTETPDNVSVIAANGGGNWVQIKGRYFSSVADDSALLSLITSEGDIAFVTADNTTYIKNNGAAGTMADWSIINEDSSFMPNINIQTTAYEVTEEDKNGTVCFQSLIEASVFEIPTFSDVPFPVGTFIDVVNESNFYVVPLLDGSDTFDNYQFLPPQSSVRFQKNSQDGSGNSAWSTLFFQNTTVGITNLVGTTSITIAPQHNNQELIIGSTSTGSIVLPDNGTQFLPIGFTVSFYNSLAIPFVFSVSSGDSITNNQSISPKNNVSITKIAIDGSDVSTWLINKLDMSTTTPRKTFLISAGSLHIIDATYNNSDVYFTNDCSVTLIGPLTSNGLYPGSNTYFKNISTSSFSHVNFGAPAIDGDTTWILNQYEAVKFEVQNGQWFIQNVYQMPITPYNPDVPRTVVYKNSSFNITDTTYNNTDVYFTNGIGCTLSNPGTGGIVDGINTLFKNISGSECELNGNIDGLTTVVMPNYTAYQLEANGSQWSIITSYSIPSASNIVTTSNRTSGTYFLSNSDSGTLIVCDDTAPLEIALPSTFPAPNAVLINSGAIFPTTLVSSFTPIAGQASFTIPLGTGVILTNDGTQFNITGSSIPWPASTNLLTASMAYTVGALDQGTSIVATNTNIEILLPEANTGAIPNGWQADFYNASTTPLAFTGLSSTTVEGYNTVYMQPGYRGKLSLDATTGQYIFLTQTNFLNGGIVSFVNQETSNYSPGSNQMGQAFIANYPFASTGPNPIVASMPGCSQVASSSLVWLGSSGTQQTQIAPQGTDTIGNYEMPVLIPPNSGVGLYQTSPTDWELIGNPQNNRNNFTVSGNLTLSKLHWGGIIEMTTAGALVIIPRFQTSYVATNAMVEYFWCTVKNGSTGNVTITTNSPDTLDGVTSVVIPPYGSLEFHGRPDPGANHNNFYSLNSGNGGGGVSSVKVYEWAAPPTDSFSSFYGSSQAIQGSALPITTVVNFPFKIPSDFYSLVSLIIVYYVNATSLSYALTINSSFSPYDGSGSFDNGSNGYAVTPVQLKFNNLDISSLFTFVDNKSWGTISIQQTTNITAPLLVVGFILTYNTIPS